MALLNEYFSYFIKSNDKSFWSCGLWLVTFGGQKPLDNNHEKLWDGKVLEWKEHFFLDASEQPAPSERIALDLISLVVWENWQLQDQSQNFNRNQNSPSYNFVEHKVLFKCFQIWHDFVVIKNIQYTYTDKNKWEYKIANVKYGSLLLLA